IRNNPKYADDALRFAKMAAADLEANRSFAIMGQGPDRIGLALVDPKSKQVVYDFTFKDRNAADGWMNLYIGFITGVTKKDLAGALPYLYKSTKLLTDQPKPYELIGDYYSSQAEPLINQINQMIADNGKETDADKIKANNDAIKAKVAVLNGVAERAMDAYSRAYTTSPKAEYKTAMKEKISSVYKTRYPDKAPMTVDQWIASTVNKPFVDPATPIQPIADPEPVKTTTGPGSGVGAANGTGVGAANGTGVGAANGTGVGAANGTGVGGAKTTTTPAKTQTPAKTTTGTAVKKPGGVAVKKSIKKRGA
ncbi:MAG: hypothetical protein JO314_13050, partial [Acidobacteria bacterium]|nr:hypothetical protein [Acidobacteriota bacterium]